MTYVNKVPMSPLSRTQEVAARKLLKAIDVEGWGAAVS